MANPEIDNYVPPTPPEYVLTVGRAHSLETPGEREIRLRRQAKELLAATLTAIQNMGYHVEHTTTNSNVDVKAFSWFTLKKIK
jgi:hypothetical protein